MSEENENKKEVEIQEESAPEYDGDELKVIQAYQDKCKSNEETYEKARGLVPEMRKELLLLLEGTPHQADVFEEDDLLRYLVARDLKPDKAASMFVAFLEYETKAQVWDVVEEDVEEFFKTGEAFLYGSTKSGLPVVWADAGKHDGKNRSLEGYIQFIHRMCLEGVLRAEKVDALKYKQIVLVVDLASYGWNNMDTPGTKGCLKMLDLCMPERVANIYLTNTGWVFWAFWKIISPFVPKRTKEKIVFLKSQKDWEPVFSALWDEDQVISRYNGKADYEFKYESGMKLFQEGRASIRGFQKEEEREPETPLAK